MQPRPQSHRKENLRLRPREISRIKQMQLTRHRVIVVHQRQEIPIPFRSRLTTGDKDGLLNHMRLPREIYLCFSRNIIKMRKRVVQRVSTAEHRCNPRKVCAEARVQHVEEDMSMGLRGVAIIDAVELRVVRLKDAWFGEVQIFGSWVDREADKLGTDRAGLWCVSLRVGPPEENILLA